MSIKFTLFFCLLTMVNTRFIRRIIGGRNANYAEVPNMVAIEALRFDCSYLVICGGIILNPFWILTTGRCINEIVIIWTIDRILIRLGKKDIDQYERNQQTVNIDKTFTHDNFESHNIDGGLIKSKTAIEYNMAVQTYQLAMYTEDPIGFGWIAGWGLKKEHRRASLSPSRYLQILQVELISRTDCIAITQDLLSNEENELNITEYIINHSIICTGPLIGEVSACNGDLGGPLLQINNFQEIEVIGIITNITDPCGCAGCPILYVKIPYLLPWINRIIIANPSMYVP